MHEPAPSPTQRRILLVDDDRGSRETTACMLLPERHKVILAASGTEALAILREQDVDLVLLDVMMPDVDGYDVCRALRKSKRNHDVQLIMLTALDSNKDLVKGLNAGADEFLSKPIDSTVLRTRVRTALRLRDAHERLKERTRQVERLLQVQRSLAGFLVHDLKNPLTAICSGSEFLQGAPLEPPYAETAQDIRDCAEDMHRMVMNILDALSSEHTNLIVHAADVDLGKLFGKLRAPFRARAAERGLNLSVDDPAGAHVRGDRDLLRRTLENLLDNAIRHTPAWGRVHAGHEARAEGHLLYVEDSGHGVKLEDRETIFDTYWSRVADSFAEPGLQSHSRGLGLAFARLAAEAHGGTISVQDSALGGARFELLLPNSPTYAQETPLLTP